MKIKMKDALIFGGFVFLNSLLASILTGEPFFTKVGIISALIIAVAFGYIFGFVLKGSFGWKNKKEEITK